MPIIAATPTNPAVEYDINVKQGTDVDIVVTAEDESGPRNLAGFTAQMHVREFVDSDGTLLEFSTADDTLDIAGSTVTIKIRAAMTTGADWTSGVYDLMLTSGDGKPECLMEGAFNIKQQITR